MRRKGLGYVGLSKGDTVGQLEMSPLQQDRRPALFGAAVTLFVIVDFHLPRSWKRQIMSDDLPKSGVKPDSLCSGFFSLTPAVSPYIVGNRMHKYE